MAKKTLFKRHYLVKGVKKDLRGFGGFQYPERGIIEAPDWNGDAVWRGGIFGIDWDSFWSNIRNDIYLIIKYNPKDGIVRFGRSEFKIRKGIVVYASSNIRDIQKWLEAHGDRYRGYGANLTVGDNETIECGDKCTVIAGNNCNISVLDDCAIKAGDNCNISGMNHCVIMSGDDSKVTVHSASMIDVGKESRVISDHYNAKVSAGIGSVLTWKTGYFIDSYEIEITEKDSGKVFEGKDVNRCKKKH